MSFTLTQFANFAKASGCPIPYGHLDIIAELEHHRLHHGGGRIVINYQQHISNLSLPHLITLYFHWLNTYVYRQLDLHTAVIAPNARPLRCCFNKRERRTIHFADSRTPFALRSQPLHFALIYNADRFDTRPFLGDRLNRPRFIHFLSSALASLPIVTAPVHLCLANRHYPHAPVSMMVILANLNRRRLPTYLRPYINDPSHHWLTINTSQAIAHQQEIRRLKRQKAPTFFKRRAGCPNLPHKINISYISYINHINYINPTPLPPQFTHYALSIMNYIAVTYAPVKGRSSNTLSRAP